MPTKKEIRKENKRVNRTNTLNGFDFRYDVPHTYLHNYKSKAHTDPYDNFTISPMVIKNAYDHTGEGYGDYWFCLYECKSDEQMSTARILYEYMHRGCGNSIIKMIQSEWIASETVPIDDVNVLMGNVGWNVLRNIKSVLPKYIIHGKIAGYAWRIDDGNGGVVCFELLGTNRFFIINGSTS